MPPGIGVSNNLLSCFMISSQRLTHGKPMCSGHRAKGIIGINQKGYTSVLFLALFASVALALFSLYDGGVVSSERIRLQNTADNVVYSTTNMVTRDMNVIAITNRGMIANQVAVGQVVALSSWSNMLHEFSGNLETLGDWVQWIPYIGKLIEQFTEIVHRATTQLRNAIKTLGSGFIFAEDKLIKALSALQRINHRVTIGAAASVFTDVQKKNDSDTEVSALVSAYNISRFISAYDDSSKTYKRSHIKRDKNTAQRHVEFSNMVNDSRDRMTANRSYKVFGRFWIPRGCDITWSRIWDQKHGGTDFTLTKEKRGFQWSWTSLDSYGFWWRYKKLSLSGCRKKRQNEFLPLGWGAAHALDKKLNRDRFDYEHHPNRSKEQKVFANGQWNLLNYNQNQNLGSWGHAWKNNRSTPRVKYPTWHQGESRGDIYNNLRRVSGLQNFIDLRKNEKTNYGPEFSILLTKRESKFSTQKTIDTRNNAIRRSSRLTIEEEGGVPDDKLYSVASAQSYFSRPDELKGRGSKPWMIKWGRRDKLKEYANLYNPFWQTRLKKNDTNIVQVLVAAGVIK
ncbi:Tad domain-containing protein [Shewanella submarina]|uniref:Tad domain-containing protein n=1 Tax=Shewanella submarina TaxID=2016376 RepID=A0ABV7G9T0_9GAMM|nr:Tad domain-containing protein [Shewanella submarina]MCL1037375.1 Tad domain-containing protein [Shewanella submarina]